MEWQRNTSVGCSDEDQDSITITDGSTSYTISGLEEDSRYTITVTASTVGGSAVSAILTEITPEAGERLPLQAALQLKLWFISPAPSEPPSSVRVSSDNSSSITVHWGSVDCIHQNGDITGYSVRYKVKGSSGDPQTQSVTGGSVSQTTIMNLMAATTYSIEVAAVTGGSRVGPYSSPVDGVIGKDSTCGYKTMGSQG